MTATQPNIYDTTASHGGQLLEEDRFTGAVDSTPDEKTVENYDSMGRISEVDEYAGTTRTRQTIYGHNPITGNLSQVISPEGTINYEYDPATNQHTRTYTTSNDTRYGYDNQGRLKTVTENKLNGQDLSSAPLVTTYTYNSVGETQSIADPNGVTTTYTYDGLDRLTGETVANGSRNLFSQQFDLNANGNRQDVTEKHYDNSGILFSTTKVAWTYDADDHLTSEKRDEGNDNIVNGGDYTDTYSYDLDGNRIKKVHDAVGATNDLTTASTYNERDQLTADGPDANNDGTPDTSTKTTYAYDSNGSMTSATTGSNVKKYTWDLRNRMTGYDANGDGDTSDTGDATYSYDNDGDRVSKNVVGTGAIYYLNDTQNPTGYDKALEEKSTQTGAPTRSYILALDVIGQSSAGTVNFLLKDAHGNTRTLTDTSGNIASANSSLVRYDYDAFGNGINFDPSTTLTIWLNPDGTYDAETGFTNQLARETDRRTGRFISADNIDIASGDWQNAGLYSFVNGNPLNLVDVTGHSLLLDVLTSVGIAAAIMSTELVGILGAIRFARSSLTQIPQYGLANIDVVANDYSEGWIPFYSGYGNYGILLANGISYLNPVADATLQSNNDADMVDQIANWVATHNNSKVKNLVFRCHGSNNGFYTGSTSSPADSIDNDIVPGNSRYNKGIADKVAELRKYMAPNASITIEACYAGRNKSMLQALANLTGATVTGGVSGDVWNHIGSGQWVTVVP